MTSKLIPYRYLRLFPFKDLFLWDVKRMLRNRIDSDFPIAKLGRVITEQNNKEKLNDRPNEDFKILGVNNKIGLFDAYTIKGNKINQPYKKVELGWLTFNPYRVNVGSIGIKLPHHQYDYISPAYVVFSCDKELHPEYLFLLFKTDTFNEIIKENTTGSVRQNLLFSTLSELEIPLPPLGKQIELVSSYYKQVRKSEQQQAEVEKLEKEIEVTICELLGIRLKKINIEKGINIFSFKEITKWSVDYILKQAGLSSLKKSLYPLVPLDQVIDYLQYGISEKSNVDSKGTVVLRMNNIQNRKIDLTDLKHCDFEVSNLNKSRVLLEKGDLLFNRTNSKELVGKTAVFDLSGEYSFASYIIRLRFQKDINPYYVNYFLNSQIGRIQIDLFSRQILGQANINSQEIRDILIPLPPLKIQNNIVDKLNNIVEEQAKLLIKSNENKTLALKQFEMAVFSL